MPYADPEVRRARSRDYYARNRESLLVKKRRYNAANRVALNAGTREYMRARRNELRRVVFEHYGTSCATCGTTSDLQLDHVNNDGARHRAELGANGSGWRFYDYLVRNGFPDDYELQTLCGLCNRQKKVMCSA